MPQPEPTGGTHVSWAHAKKLVGDFKGWAPEGEGGEALRTAAGLLEAAMQRQKAAAEQAAEQAKRDAEAKAAQAASEAATGAAANMDVEADSKAEEERQKAAESVQAVLQAHLQSSESLDDSTSKRRAEELMEQAGAIKRPARQRP